jgi:hypothetical protein
METRKRPHHDDKSLAGASVEADDAKEPSWLAAIDNDLAEEIARGRGAVPRLLEMMRQRNRELMELRRSVRVLRDQVHQLEQQKELRTAEPRGT